MSAPVPSFSVVQLGAAYLMGLDVGRDQALDEVEAVASELYSEQAALELVLQVVRRVLEDEGDAK